MIVYMKIFLFDLLLNKIGYHGDSKKTFLIPFVLEIFFIIILIIILGFY